MLFAYIRVSTDRQTNENQRFELERYASQRNWTINEWVEETVSTTVRLEDRKLSGLLEQMRAGDRLLVTELSRIGRNLMQVMGILNQCMERDIFVCTAKEGYELGNNLNAKILAFAFGLSAEIERNLISQRTKEAMARRKAEGIHVGRPKGSKSKKRKLTGKDDEIKRLLDKRVSVSAIGRLLGVHRLTVAAHVKQLQSKKTE